MQVCDWKTMHIDTRRCLEKRMLNKLLLRKRARLDARKYRESARVRMKKATMSVPLLGKRCEMSDGAADATGNDAAEEGEGFIAKNGISSAKRQRENLDLEDCYCLSNAGPSIDLHGISHPQDGKESNSRRCLDLDKEYVDDGQVDPCAEDQKDGRHEVCYNCMHGGMLLCCHGKGCQRRYHPSCLDPPLSCVPPGVWHCIWCVKKKIELGVHSISEGVESIWDSREMVLENEVMQTQYLVKYQGLAHAHNRWIPEEQLLLEAPKLLAKFNRKVQVIRWKQEWAVPQRLLLKREVVLLKQPDESSGRHDHHEWLVKWTGLGYDHVTWELDDASFMTSAEGMKLIADFEIRHKRTEKLSNLSEVDEVLQEGKASPAELSKLSSGDSRALYNHLLSYVNKIRMFWHRGQSALIVDVQVDQERVKKVILFILSLLCSIERPILIISTSNTLSVWEEEFLHLAPSANLIVYKGTKDVRNSIRTLEFYNNDGGIMFHILLSSSDIIIEDLHALQYMAWEAIIIDECQLHRISKHFDDIKMLATKMRLLIISGQIKEQPDDYLKLLFLLDSGFHKLNGAQMETNCPSGISKLKKQLAQYVAFECSSSSLSFIEYWVPVQLSNLQLEQYCSMLLSNSMFLCSGMKTNTVDALSDLIISVKKCCDHPYLLDQSLQGFITKGLPVEEYLNIGIKASGKLQLLDRILMEVRSRGLRVIIIYQSAVGSGSIGDILDDLVCQRFGKKSYVRYYRGLIPPKKQAALDKFNEKGSGNFVFLIENRACIPSIKLSSVDSVVLFNSDWDPQNDLRAIQKMSISSRFEQLKVFRLYTSFTVEEKVLMLAKDGIALDSNMQWINQSNCQTLLKWNASHLFRKLDDLHGCGTSFSASDISSDQLLLSNVICELSTLLPYGGDSSDHDSSFILQVVQNGGLYERHILLLGERMMEKLVNGPQAFSWTSVFNGRHPKWKFLSLSSQRIRKKVNYFDPELNKSKFDHNVTIRKTNKVSYDPLFVKSTLKNKKNLSAVSKASTDIVDPAHLTSSLKKKKKPSAANISIMGIIDPICPKSRSNNKKKPSSVRKASKGEGNKDYSCKVPDSVTICHLTTETTRGPEIGMESVEQKKLFDMPKSNELLPKPDISGLCDVLHLSKKIKAVAMMILEHILQYYSVNCQQTSTLQAFGISLCWLAASLSKQKIDRKESLALAKLHLNFDCKEEEATEIYSKLHKVKKDFSRLKNRIGIEKCYTHGSDSKTQEVEDLVGKNRQRKSPTRVPCLQRQNYTKNVYDGPSGSLPTEADAISIESEKENDRMSALASKRAEVSLVGHDNKAPGFSYDPHHEIPLTGSLERQNSVRSTEITESDRRDCEDPQILVNQVVTEVHMLTHPEQLNSAEIDADSFNGTAVPVLREWKGAATCVCDESTALEFNDTTSTSLWPSHGNLSSSPQMARSEIPSFSEDKLACTVMPLDMNTYQSNVGHFNMHGAEVILQEPNGPVKPFNTFFVQSMLNVQKQPSTDPPTSENAMLGRNDPEVTTGDLFLEGSFTSEMPHTVDLDPLRSEIQRTQKEKEEALDPLQNEIQRIQKEKEEALKTRDKTMLQLQSDCEKDIERVYRKYDILLHDANAAVTLRRKELEANYDVVFLNKLLAETLSSGLDDYKMAVSQCTGQVASSHGLTRQTAHMHAESLVNNFTGSPVKHLLPMTPPVEVVSLSTVIPESEVSSVRPGSSPMMQQRSANHHNGFEFRAPAPHLRACIPAPSNSVHSARSM